MIWSRKTATYLSIKNGDKINMPGIYGFTKKSDSADTLHQMTKALQEITPLSQGMLVKDNYLEMSQIHLEETKSQCEIFQKEGIYILIEGEKYNLQSKNFENLLFDSYVVGQLSKTLSQIDGYFNAIIYDSITQAIHLMTDRYGMRMLYYSNNEDQFAWSAEVKGLLALSSVNKSIDKQSVKSFIELGYILESKTLFSRIKLLSPSTLMTFNLQSKKLSQNYYWKWSAIKNQEITLEQAIDKLGILFLDSVKRRFEPNKKMGIALSGGLDSRAIVAAVTKIYPEYVGELYTFGIEGCDDIEIAKMVAKKTNWNHKVYNFTTQNWFEARFNSIWRTDGMLSMQHMHGSEFVDDIAMNVEINLNGYAGDVVCGGGWFKSLPLDTKASSENMKPFYKNQTSQLSFDSDFYDIEKTEPHLFMNKVRRFTNMGTVNSLDKINQRKPFFDNSLIEFVLSIPDEYRQDNKLYRNMLLKFFPDFFQDIPWQKTRKTISGDQCSELRKDNVIRGYMNYAKAIRDESVLSNIVDTLNFNGSKYSEFVNVDPIKQYLKPHLASCQYSYADEIFRFFTLEYYLRKALQHDQ
jgi:asparagine synthase (glutamine-hydrolysing)